MDNVTKSRKDDDVSDSGAPRTKPCMRIEVSEKGVVISNLDDIAPSTSNNSTGTIVPTPYKRKRRRKEEGYLQDVYLPPCRICGDLSSGYHYGANTCEACKGFFRRSLKKVNKTYRCKCTPMEKEKKTDGPVLNGCGACRYNRCLQVGMSKEAIKIGRYTSMHRTQNITEIKSITAGTLKTDTCTGNVKTDNGVGIAKTNDRIGFVKTDNLVGISKTDDRVRIGNRDNRLGIVESDNRVRIVETSNRVGIIETHDRAGIVNPKDRVCILQPEDSVPVTKESDTSSSGSGPGSIGDSTYLGLSSPEDLVTSTTHSPFISPSLSSTSSITEVKPRLSKHQLSFVSTDDFFMPIHSLVVNSAKARDVFRYNKHEIEAIVDTLHEAHNATLFKKDTQPKDHIEKDHKEHLEMLKLKKEVFGDLKALSKEEHTQFYNTTGIDIDGRHRNFQLFIEEFQNKIKKIIRFSKSIPGFRDLSQDDQIGLIKHSRAEVFIITGFRNICKFVNLQLGVITMPWNTVVHRNEGQNIFPWELTQAKFKYSHRINQLGIDDKEQAVLRAIVLTFPDRCDLSDPDAVDAIQEKLFICLQHLLKSRLPDNNNIMYRIFDMLISLRELTEIDNRIMKDLLFEYQTQDGSDLLDDVVV